MKMNLRKGRLVGALCIAALIGAACGSGSGGSAATSGGAEGLSGEIVVSGSSTVEPISALVAEKFQGANPDVSISVDGPGTGDGFELFCQGETDVSDASRPIKLDEEAPVCEENGVEFIEIKVGIDGMAVLTSPENSAVDCLSFADLYALTGPESEGFEDWSDANSLAEEIGAAGAPYPDVPLDVVGPGEESGTYDSYVELALEGIAEERGVPEEEFATRPDYQSSPNDNVIIEGIQGSASSLGWVGYSFYSQNTDTVRALAVDDGESGCVEPTEETIQSAEYPLARFLYIYVNAAEAEKNDALSAFVDYYLSEEGIASVAEVGYVGLAEDDFQISAQAWDAREVGSREDS